GELHPADRGAVGPRIVDAGAIAVALAHLAEVGEPEAAGGVEDEVVRALERMLAALRVERLDLAGAHVDALDAAAAVTRGLFTRQHQPADVVPLEAAVVGDVDGAVRPDRRAVRPAAALGDDLLAAVRMDTRQRAGPDLHPQH